MERFRVEVASHALESHALADLDARSRVTLAPARGGLATRFSVGDDEVLYLDEGTLNDASKNVRGGIPVLFPSPGKLVGDAWSRGGHGGRLGQHGFARNVPWTVTEIATEGSARCSLDLVSGEATRAAWPWEFSLRHRFSLCGALLRIEQRVQNAGAAPMPFGLGFHPYFRVSQADKPGAEVESQATRAWDNVAGSEIGVSRIDLSGREVDLHLLDHGSSSSALVWRGGKRGVRLRASEEYERWVVWTLAGRDFVCLEPWTSPGNALNSGTGLLELEPGEARELWVEIEAFGFGV